MMMWVRLAAFTVWLAGGACALVTSAEADDEPIRTVRWKVELFTQGAPFEVECEHGSYLVGFDGRAGAWINHLRLVCSRWNAERGKLERPVVLEERKVGYSQGGGPTSAKCPVGTGIADHYGEHYSLDDGNYVLHTLEFHCVHATDGMRPRWREFGSTSPIGTGWAKPDRHPGCPEGYLATGIYGRAGEFVDKFFGFVCRRRPTASPVAEATPPYGDVARAPERARSSMGSVSIMTKTPRAASTRLGNDIVVGGGGAQPPPPASPAAPTATAIEDVDIYDGAGGQFTVIGMLGKGSTVPVITHNAEKDWYLLKAGNITGWVAADWLKINP